MDLPAGSRAVTEVVSSQALNRKKDKAIEEGVQALLRNELIRRYREYQDKGSMTILDKENVEAMFKQYENLGGNGMVKQLMQELLSSQTKMIK